MEFFACGDAVGKATEFMTLDNIRKNIGTIGGLIDPGKSQNHPDLKLWEVTDDTEQNLYLLRTYLKDGTVSIGNTVSALVSWINETGAVAKHYIGPSSLAALTSIQKGEDPLKTGLGGITCGGIMRTPALVFASLLLGMDLDTCVYYGVVPTHNTSQAMEAAYAYAYALRAAINGEGVIPAARKGCLTGLEKAPYEAAGARLYDRLGYLEKQDLQTWSKEDLKTFLYGVMGTGLVSYETAGAVFALSLYTKDPMEAIYVASETGGDTDTIAALAGGLVSMMNPEAEIDRSVIAEIKGHIDLAAEL